MGQIRLAVLGGGFWAQFQIAAWQELADVEIVAIYNRTQLKAEQLAQRFSISGVYNDVEELLRIEKPDVVDIITDMDTHRQFVTLAAKYKIPVICQKPLAPSLLEAEQMVAFCEQQGVPFFVHENWRWQTPLRQLKRELEENKIGKPFRARIQFSSSFPVFDNQPFLKELDQFILMDIGSHILDTARFLFGDVQRLYCQTKRVNPTIRGEDVATVMLEQTGITCTCEMSYASRLEHERFPETFVLVEGEQGSLELGPDYWIRRTTAAGTFAYRCPPHHYSWADPAYDLVHASIVSCNANILHALRKEGTAETQGSDNIKTVRLVFRAYESAQNGLAIHHH